MKMKSKRNFKLKDPENISFTGSQFLKEANLQIIEYSDNFHNELKNLKYKDLFDLQKSDRVYWVNLHGIHDIELVKSVCKKYGVHDLVVEDILDVTQRPKIQEFKDQLFFTVKSILPTEGSELEIEHISFILGKNFVLSFQEKIGDHFEHIRHRLRESKGVVREKGADYLLYLLLEAILDNYQITTEKIDEKVNVILKSLNNSEQKQSTIISIEDIKDDLRVMKKSMSPIKEALISIDKGTYVLIDKDELKYYYNIKDECMMTLDDMEENIQKLDSGINLFFSLQTHKANQIMMTLTIVATIFIPLTFIVGVYGMNFDYMPELKWQWGYFGVWAVMLTIIGIMLYKFKKNKWF
ncbi:MAG: magnesium/cobalt transporter CorA [Candidatus Delongbacteria bacterium]|nr:magnesium/cobalt transporter CorA [Candidatus Delongbacteria bacterium]MCG2761068.1 magnesium/cobalt transporter CorA [Candidatus Delongbacteria bacterium]